MPLVDDLRTAACLDSRQRVCFAGIIDALWNEFAHRTTSAGPVNNQFGMLTPKSFCDMAAPADGPVSLEDLRQFFSRELAPLHHLPVRAHQGGPMVMPMDFAEQLAAVDASSPSVPVGDLRPDQAILWIRSDLTEAFLSAVLALGPAGAFS